MIKKKRTFFRTATKKAKNENQLKKSSLILWNIMRQKKEES